MTQAGTHNDQENSWATYRRDGVAHATKLTAPRTWTTANGDQLTSYAGDWWVTDATGAGRGVAADRFPTLYEPLPHQPDTYRRRGTVRAVRLTAPLTIDTIEGPTEAPAGAWLVDDGTSRWPVPHEHFTATYTIN